MLVTDGIFNHMTEKRIRVGVYLDSQELLDKLKEALDGRPVSTWFRRKAEEEIKKHERLKAKMSQ